MSRAKDHDRRAYVESADDWRENAACKGMDPDLFFPEEHDRETEKEAKATCASCVVWYECLMYAIDTREPRGIWGGESSRARRRIMISLREGEDPWA